MTMKPIAAALAGLVAAATAHATPFSYSGAIETYTVAESGLYAITVIGAAGGTSLYGNAGGQGAEVSGVFSLSAGTVLSILVGQQGYGGYGAGGGGGSFVVSGDGSPLAVAGGGGGAYLNANDAADAGTSAAGTGGGASGRAAGGGGLLGDGAALYTSYTWFYGAPGLAFASGGAGGTGGTSGAQGGFGGGGGGGTYGGGGGGGYIGGDGGAAYGAGGGGGSFIDPGALDPLLLAYASTGDGSVTITELAAAPLLAPATSADVPEPASLGLFAGAAVLLRALRRRGRCP